MYKKLKKTLKYLLIIFMVFLVYVFAFKTPQQNRDWALDQSILSNISFWDNHQGFDIQNARDWEYQSLDSIKAKKYFNASYAYKDLEGIKYYVVPLDSKGLTAHTFVVFNFNNQQKNQKDLALSIEARREKNVPYSIIKGALNQYEVINVWASAKDIVTKRTLYWGDKIDEYQINLPKKDQIAILKAFLSSSQKLQTQPQFYNTLTKNCTNLLAKHINQSFPNTIPWDQSFILTGQSGRYLESLGYAAFIRTLNP